MAASAPAVPTVMPNWEEWAQNAEDCGDLLLAARYRNQDLLQQKKINDTEVYSLKVEIAAIRTENNLHRKLADEYFKEEFMLKKAKQLQEVTQTRELAVLKQNATIKRKIEYVGMQHALHVTALEQQMKDRLTKANLNNRDARIEKQLRQAAEQKVEVEKKHHIILEMQRDAALQQCRKLRMMLQPSKVVAHKHALPSEDSCNRKKPRVERAEDGATTATPLPPHQQAGQPMRTERNRTTETSEACWAFQVHAARADDLPLTDG